MTEEEFLASQLSASAEPVVIANVDILGQAVFESALASDILMDEEPLVTIDDSEWRALLAQRTLESLFDTGSTSSTPGSVSSSEYSSESLFSPSSSVNYSPTSSVEVEKPKKQRGRKRAKITPETRKEKKKVQNKEAAHR